MARTPVEPRGSAFDTVAQDRPDFTVMALLGAFGIKANRKIRRYVHTLTR
jgi:hypothetical protein